MHNIKLTIAYDGTDYRGWQMQPGQPTIQGTLGEVLQQLTQQRPILQGAGRTDAGVHAWGQVVSFKTHSELTPQEFLRGCNALLPPAIRVRQAEEVGPNFHARWMARAKTYTYSIYRGPVVPPFRWRYILHVPQELDYAAMAEAARFFEGEHDFTSFSASTGSEEEDRERTMVRCIFRSEIVKGENGWGRAIEPSNRDRTPCDEEWTYCVRGSSFLRYMVRKIVGTLIWVGRGRLAAAEIPRLLEKRDRACSGPTAPPQGLCLQSVEYPDPTASLIDNIEE
ncbi:MAG TPA: tRNA pseudouridine(38-40) synthase TruA [Candidatus Acidoferrales bacterium]|nr:tRNA pseudouridine(38-40) synthase TruA [Candidatus Acidoferrales bacterium]